MKVLFVSNDPSLFDAESTAHARMREYAALIGELHILSVGNTQEVSSEGALTLHAVTAMKIRRPFVLRRAARDIIRTYGIDVVSAQDPFEHGWAALQAVKGTDARLHIQVHTDFLSPWFVKGKTHRSPKVPAPLLNHVRRRLADKVLPQAHGIRTVSVRVRDSLVARYGNRIPTPSVIPIGAGGVVPDAVPLPPHEFSFALVTAGRLEPEKRIDDILYALARIGYRYSSVGLVIIGDGRARAHLEHLVQHLGLQKRVVFAGWQEGKAWAMMRSGHAYIQASAYEGYGRTLLEAALAGMPIITTDVGIVGDVFVGYEDVLSAPVGDPAALATHIMGLVEDHQARHTYAQSAKRKAETYVAQLGDLPRAVMDDLARTLITR